MISIPAELARRLKIEEGDEVAVEGRESEIVVRPSTPVRKLFDSWEPIGPPPDAQEMIEWFRQERERRR